MMNREPVITKHILDLIKLLNHDGDLMEISNALTLHRIQLAKVTTLPPFNVGEDYLRHRLRIGQDIDAINRRHRDE